MTPGLKYSLSNQVACLTNDTPVTKQHQPVRAKVLNYFK